MGLLLAAPQGAGLRIPTHVGAEEGKDQNHVFGKSMPRKNLGNGFPLNTGTGEERSCLRSLLSLLPKVKLPFGISEAIEECKSQLPVFHLQTSPRGSAKSILLFRGFVEFPAYLNAIKVTKKKTPNGHISCTGRVQGLSHPICWQESLVVSLAPCKGKKKKKANPL